MDGDMGWLIEDLNAELLSWGHAGGDEDKLILKTDGEPALCAVRDALARRHGTAEK